MAYAVFFPVHIWIESSAIRSKFNARVAAAKFGYRWPIASFCSPTFNNYRHMRLTWSLAH